MRVVWIFRGRGMGRNPDAPLIFIYFAGCFTRRTQTSLHCGGVVSAVGFGGCFRCVFLIVFAVIVG